MNFLIFFSHGDIGLSMWIVDVAMCPLRCLGTMCNLALGGLWARIYNLVVAMYWV